MKKTVFLTLLMLAIFSLPAIAANVTVDGEPVEFPGGQGATIVDGRTLIPVRGVFETLGFEITWQESPQTVFITNSSFEVVILIGSGFFLTNGEIYELDVPAQIIDGRTMLPIRAVVESVGYEVGWDAETSTVVITT